MRTFAKSHQFAPNTIIACVDFEVFPWGPGLGGEFDQEILMGPACVIPSLGLWTSISALGCRAAVPLGLVLDFVAK